jgi:hypothetical protein
MVAGGENIQILEEREQRHSSRGRNGHRGYEQCTFSVTSESYPLFKRGDIIQRNIKGIQTGGESPRRFQVGQATPRGE